MAHGDKRMRATSFALDLDQVDWVGHDLMRPECVLASRAGRLYASDWRGGVMVIEPDGRQTPIGLAHSREQAKLMPNGIALWRDGTVLIANLGSDGGVWRLWPDGRCEPWLTHVSGWRLPPVNFVWLDAHARVWMTVMFRSHDTEGAQRFRADQGDGCLVLADHVDQPGGARIVADGLFTPNECRIALDGRSVLVNETFSHRVARYALRADGSLGARDILAEFDALTLPDGLSLDAEGGLWLTCVGSNRILRVMPDGQWHRVAEDYDPEHMQRVCEGVHDGSLGRELLYRNPARVLPNVTSLAFGGPDLRTAYVGSVSGTRIARFTAPVAGVPPAHWHW
jgi:sugar lactone lactonase YvrE